MGSRTDRGRGRPARPVVGAGTRGAVALLAALGAAPGVADVWVLEPSVSLDQRLDDNYRLLPDANEEASTTRLVGNLGLSRESRTASITGGVRVDALLTQGDFEGEALDSNQVLFFNTTLGDARTRWNVDVDFKQDTPNRDISADLSGDDSEPTDNGVVTQSYNLARRRLVVAPSVTRDLTRRASVTAGLKYTGVAHDLPSPEDAIYTRYLGLYAAQNAEGFAGEDIVPEAENGDPLPIGEVDNATVGVFTPDAELDDYQEAELDLPLRYALSPISAVSTTLRYSRYVADSVPDASINVPFSELVREGQTDIYRDPRGRDSISTTTSLRLGYERSLTPTLRGEVEAGVYVNTTDDTDTFRESDRDTYIPVIANFGTAEARALSADEYLETLESEQEGWLASVRLTKDAGLTRYSARFGVDVQPSSVGSQVEAQELVGDVYRTITPLIQTSLRVRLYEPDRLGANPDNRFARRFLSVEPKIVYRFSRAWTAGASYRYRRQKSRAEVLSGESNALLFSLTYTPPSAVRDASRL